MTTPQVPGLPGMPEPTNGQHAHTPGGGPTPLPIPAPSLGDAGSQLRALVNNFTLSPDILPLEMQVAVIQVQGRPFILMVFMTTQGMSYYFMDPESAIQFATNLAMNAKQATTGLHLPGGFVP